jgi:hypothetical protein
VGGRCVRSRSAALAERLAERSGRTGQSFIRTRFHDRAQDTRQHANLLRGLLEGGSPAPPELQTARIQTPEQDD